MGATMNEVNSYIGLQQLQKVSILIAQQRANGKAWETRLEMNNNYRKISINREINPNNWVMGMLYLKGRIEGIEYFRKLGYSASTVHLPNNRYSVFGYKADTLKGVEEFYNHFVAVPSGWWVKENEI
jgi:dTDP-4-amino-4,6-dideoxygalactose transaminase